MIDLKHEIERELSLIDPPDLWDRIQADASNNGDAAVLDLTTARHRRRPSLWLAVAAVTVLLALVGAVALLEDHQTIDTTPATEVPVVPKPPTNHDRPTTLAKGEDVEIVDLSEFAVGDWSELAGQTLNIDAVEQDGEVTGEFRVNNVVVTLQCAATRGPTETRRDLILGGQVTDDPDGQGLRHDAFDDDKLAVGDLVALIIREDHPDSQRVTLYAGEPVRGNDNPGSCTELVESVPGSLDGGFFNDVADGDDIETEPFSPTLAKGEDVEIGGFGDLDGQTLNIDAEEEDGEVTGEFRVDNVVVTIQCADTRSLTGAQSDRRELILGGEVTDNTDDLATLDEVNVGVGDLLALIIREDHPDGQRVTLYHPSIWYGEQASEHAGSCDDLVDSVPPNLDGGFFDNVEDIETG